MQSAHTRRVVFAVAALVAGCPLWGCGRAPLTPQERFDRATSELARATTPQQKFYALGAAAKTSFDAGKIEDARSDATELLSIAPQFQQDWNYGNAVHDANLVLGRIAVTEGRMDDAKRSLLAAGRSPGSPQLNSFGPNMSLAKDLLDKGERDTVLEYFQLCRTFWKRDGGQLDRWREAVKAGKTPDFGANLLY